MRNIVPVLAAGDAGGLLYYMMPFVDGESLRSRLARVGELPVAEAARVLRDLAKALAYAHARGLVHRDIKPENILLTGDGDVVVADFGVAKAIVAATGDPQAGQLTSAGVAIGTPAYMAPEQAAADPTADHRIDLYALGVVAYELLSGSPPFAGRPVQALLAAHATESPEDVSRRRPAVPPALAALVMRCLEKRPADRPQTAEEVVRELRQIDADVSGSRQASGPSPRRSAGRRALVVAGRRRRRRTGRRPRVVARPPAGARGRDDHRVARPRRGRVMFSPFRAAGELGARALRAPSAGAPGRRPSTAR